MRLSFATGGARYRAWKRVGRVDALMVVTASASPQSSQIVCPLAAGRLLSTSGKIGSRPVSPLWVDSGLSGHSAVLEIPDIALTSSPVPHPIPDNPTGADLALLPKSATLTYLGNTINAGNDVTDVDHYSKLPALPVGSPRRARSPLARPRPISAGSPRHPRIPPKKARFLHNSPRVQRYE
jgi:hypothetical protein